MATTADADEVEYRGRLQRALGADLELRDLIGRGGFGAVYAAWDRKLDREVAVKALRHDLFPTRLVLERFQREAKAVAKLRHAHILPVYAVGEGEGVAYMVMPVVRGESVRSLLAKPDPIDASLAIRIVADVARALGAAHRLGIIHRDVKPENILLEGDERNALLADFGIAKSADGDGGGITGTGVVLGSPQYMSPEQASADQELDGRSDVYSLGAVAYELLARRRPYEAQSMQQLLVLQFTTEPTPLAQAAPAVPAPAREAVMRALMRDPAQRWQTATDFAAALERALAPVATTETQSSWFARRGPLFALAYLGGLYLNLMNMTILLGRGPIVDMASKALARPLATICVIGILLMMIELLVTIVGARRSGVPRAMIRRRAFGQPSWWQAWYPRSLRDPDNVWDRMPLSMRVMRTLVWLAVVVVPVAMPLIFVAPELDTYARDSGIPIALPMRIMIWGARHVPTPLMYAGMASLIGVVVLGLKHRVSPLAVLGLLFTWRASAWDSPAGRRLMGVA